MTGKDNLLFIPYLLHLPSSPYLLSLQSLLKNGTSAVLRVLCASALSSFRAMRSTAHSPSNAAATSDAARSR